MIFICCCYMIFNYSLSDFKMCYFYLSLLFIILSFLLLIVKVRMLIKCMKMNFSRNGYIDLFVFEQWLVHLILTKDIFNIYLYG